ncbi:MAG: hypothetical protein ACM31C_26715 [Acidobacteriota bacterium]
MRTNNNSPVKVTWKLARDASGKALKLDYEIENRTTAQIYVLDQLVTTSTPGYEVLPDRVIVRGGPDDATASLFLGFMDPPPGVAVEVEPMPVARVVAAGAKLTGAKTVPLPVAAWHPYIQYMQPLAATPTKAILEISWLPDKLPEHVTAAWEDYPSASGGKLRLPTRAYVVNAQQLARGDTLEIP